MNELALPNDLNQIEFEINHHKRVAGNSIWEIGRRLRHVKENNLAHGEFGKWLEKIKFSHDQANKMMKIAEELNSESTRNIGVEALYLIATLPEEEREKEHSTSSGDSKKVDEMTVKELQDLKRQLKEKDQQIQKLENRKPEVVEKPVIKEVRPHDYDGLKSDNNQLSQALKEEREENRKIRAQLDQWMKERESVDEKSKKYDELSSAIKEMEGKMDAQQKRVAVVKDITEKLKIGNQLIDELSGLIYLTDFEELHRNDFLASQLQKLISRMNSFANDLDKIIDQNTILEGEIINE